jgi:aryl-alcohol dehydrogenase-like predicted oxidoreductase
MIALSFACAQACLYDTLPAMEFISLEGISKPVSRLGMGTMVLTTKDPAFSFSLLDRFIEGGGTLIDTAHVYGDGDCERSLGAWLKARNCREKVVVLDKGAHPYGRDRVNPEDMKSDLNDNLERLQTHYVDLWMMHRDDPKIPVSLLVDYLNSELKAGRIRAFGCSNWSIQRIQEFQDYAQKTGQRGFSANSPNVSLAVPQDPMWAGCVSLLGEDRKWHERTKLPVIAWSAQAGGFFTGRYRLEVRDNPDAVRVYYNDENFERLHRAEELGKKKGCSANAIALAYVLCQPFPVASLIGPRALNEFDASFEALGIKLDPDEMKWLNLGF